MDSWEYLQSRIIGHNTKARVESELQKYMDGKDISQENIILKRIEKGRKIDETPSSLATTIVHREASEVEARKTNKSVQSKGDTVAIAYKATRDMNMASLVECRRLKAISRRSEEGGFPSKKLKVIKED